MATTADSLDDDADDPEEYPDGVYVDEPGTVECPYCGKDVSEFAEVCPHCKNYISFEDAPPKAKSMWIVVTAILLILISSGAAMMLMR